MNSNTRACIAYITGSLHGRNASSVYDYSQSRHISVSGTVSESSINVYDYDRGCHISGSPSSLYDYGNSAYIQLNMNGIQFSGYDYDSGNHYSGTVNGGSVSIYDYETSQHYSYSV